MYVGSARPGEKRSKTAIAPGLPTEVDWRNEGVITVVRDQVRTLTKKKIKFSSYMRKFRMEQLHSHI